MKGRLILIVGSSGSGKGTLIAHVRKEYPDIVYPISCTTRAPRPGEKDGEVYHFLTEEEFDAKIASGDFLEWASYGGNRYGTLKSEILTPLGEGKLVLREVEVQGVRSILAAMPRERIAVVFVDAGPWESLEGRIKSRAAVDDGELALRRERYEDERTFREEADYVVSNVDGELEAAKEAFTRIIAALRSGMR